MPRKAPTPASTTDYRHDATRLNNPPAGLADIAPLPASGRTRYAYDQHLDPQLVWAGKAEHLTFDVETVPLHIHERIAPAALIDALRTGRRPAGYLRGNRAQVRSIVAQNPIPLELMNTIR